MPLRSVKTVALYTACALAGLNLSIPGAAAAPAPEPPLGEVSYHSSDSSIQLSPGSEIDSRHEATAVNDFIAADPLFTDPGDVSVDTVDVGAVEVVVAAPTDEVEVSQITVQVDATNQEVSVGQKSAETAEAPVTAGPGMGSWPNWLDRPEYQVVLNSYLHGNFIGSARFSTSSRIRSVDGPTDILQVARKATAQPDLYEIGPFDYSTHVKKLWISNDPDEFWESNILAWRDAATKPLAGSSVCAVSSAGIGPWSGVISNCEDTDVWQSNARPGHMRMSMDQGTLSTGGSRSIAYVAGVTKRDAGPAVFNFYEFVTFRVAINPIPGPMLSTQGREYKCTENGQGTAGGPRKKTCQF